MNIFYHLVEHLSQAGSVKTLLDVMYAFASTHYNVRRCAIRLPSTGGGWEIERAYGFSTDSIFNDDSYASLKPVQTLPMLCLQEKSGEFLLYDSIPPDIDVDGISFSRFVEMSGFFLRALSCITDAGPRAYETLDFLKAQLNECLKTAHIQRFDFSLILVELPLIQPFRHGKPDMILNRIHPLIRDKIRGQDQVIYYEGNSVALLLPETHERGRIILERRVKSVLEIPDIYVDSGALNIAGATAPVDGLTPMDLIRKIDGRLEFDPHSLVPKISVPPLPRK